MRYLAFDTETTGVPDPELPLLHPEQPRIVQIAAILFDDERREIEVLDTLIRPDGWVVDFDSESVHGWTTEDCAFIGVPIADALSELRRLVVKADGGRVAHAVWFDDAMIAIEEAFAGTRVLHDLPEPHCTMQLSAPIVGIPFSGGGFKLPSLEQAVRGVLGRRPDPDSLHNAYTDSEWCRDVFLEILRASKE